MFMNVTLARYASKNGIPTRLLEKQTFRSRSFTRGFLEQLYLVHYQLAYGGTYYFTDLAGANLWNCDHSYEAGGSGPTESRFAMPTLFLNSGGGHGQCFLPRDKASSSGWQYTYLVSQSLANELLGIQVGGDDTAATPADWKLTQRFGHGKSPADGSNQQILVYDGDDTDWEIYGTSRWGMTMFTVPKQCRLYTVKVKMYREGSPGTVTLGVYPMFSDGFTISFTKKSAPLATGTTDGNTLTAVSPGEWREITLGSQIDLVPGLIYGIVLNISGGTTTQNIHWRYKSATPYTLSSMYGSSGSILSTLAPISSIQGPAAIDLQGRSQGEMLYGGNEVTNLVASGSNVSFDIRRFFRNLSGENRVVKEIGLTSAAGCNYFTTYPGVSSFLIARDVLASPVTVANTELLLVQYTPTIVV